MAAEPKIIDIPDDDPGSAGTTCGQGCTGAPGSGQRPVMVIEKEAPAVAVTGRGRGNAWLWAAVGALVAAVAVLAVFMFLRSGSSAIPAGMSEKQVMETLDKPYTVTADGIVPVCDTVLGIPLEMYPLDGLRASLETALPDTADMTLVAFFRSADYTPDGKAIGSTVVDGRMLPVKEQPGRDAYAAVSPQGRLAVGAGAGRTVMEYARKRGGSFFRQYLLVGDNTLPPTFSLHGKVERAALGRTEEGRLYYVMTRSRETMWGFADALREYGFIDAAYVTGGDKYDFMRRPDGTFTLGDRLRAEYAEQRGRTLKAPVLVFRR